MASLEGASSAIGETKGNQKNNANYKKAIQPAKGETKGNRKIKKDKDANYKEAIQHLNNFMPKWKDQDFFYIIPRAFGSQNKSQKNLGKQQKKTEKGVKTNLDGNVKSCRVDKPVDERSSNVVWKNPDMIIEGSRDVAKKLGNVSEKSGQSVDAKCDDVVCQKSSETAENKSDDATEESGNIVEKSSDTTENPKESTEIKSFEKSVEKSGKFIDAKSSEMNDVESVSTTDESEKNVEKSSYATKNPKESAEIKSVEKSGKSVEAKSDDVANQKSSKTAKKKSGKKPDKTSEGCKDVAEKPGGATDKSKEGNSGGATDKSKEGNSGGATDKSKEGNSGGATDKSKEGKFGGATDKSKEGESGGATDNSKEGKSGVATDKSKERKAGGATDKSKEGKSGGATDKSKEGQSDGATDKSKEGKASGATDKSKEGQSGGATDKSKEGKAGEKCDSGASKKSAKASENKVSKNEVESGDIAEKKIFEFMEAFKERADFGAVIIHGYIFLENNERKGEADFIFLSPNYKIIIFEVKAIDNPNYAEEKVSDAMGQLSVRAMNLKAGIERFCKGLNLTLKDFDVVGCVIVPNMDKFDLPDKITVPFGKSSTPNSHYVNYLSNLFVAFKDDCRSERSFHEWLDKGPLILDEKSKDIYPYALPTLIAKIYNDSVITKKIGDLSKVLEKIDLLLTPKQKLCVENTQSEIMYIYGIAGTGKTKMLQLKVQKILEDNNECDGKILITCSGINLRNYYRRFYKNLKTIDQFDIYTIDELKELVFSRANVDESRKNLYRHIFVEDAEDLSYDDVNMLETLREDKKEETEDTPSPLRFLWYFCDVTQCIEGKVGPFYFKGALGDTVENVVHFNSVFRSTWNIYERFVPYVSDPSWPFKEKIVIGHKEVGPSVSEVKTPSSTIEDISGVIFHDILTELTEKGKWKYGITPSDVLIITENDDNTLFSLMDALLKKLSGTKLKLKLLKECKEDNDYHLKMETVLGCKGIEAKICIYVLPLSGNEPSPRDLYIAASRSNSMLYMVGTTEQFLKMERSDRLYNALTSVPHKSTRKEGPYCGDFHTDFPSSNLRAMVPAFLEVNKTEFEELAPQIDNEIEESGNWREGMTQYATDNVKDIVKIIGNPLLSHVTIDKALDVDDEDMVKDAVASTASIIYGRLFEKIEDSKSLSKTCIIAEDQEDLERLKAKLDELSGDLVIFSFENVCDDQSSDDDLIVTLQTVSAAVKSEFEEFFYAFPFLNKIPRHASKFCTVDKILEFVILIGSKDQISCVHDQMQQRFGCTSKKCILFNRDTPSWDCAHQQALLVHHMGNGPSGLMQTYTNINKKFPNIQDMMENFTSRGASLIERGKEAMEKVPSEKYVPPKDNQEQ